MITVMHACRLAGIWNAANTRTHPHIQHCVAYTYTHTVCIHCHTLAMTPCMLAHTHIHIHIYAYAHIHTLLHTPTNTHLCPRTHTTKLLPSCVIVHIVCVCVRMVSYTPSYTRMTPTHARCPAYFNTNTPKCVHQHNHHHTHIGTRRQSCRHPGRRTHMNACTHIHAHIHIGMRLYAMPFNTQMHATIGMHRGVLYTHIHQHAARQGGARTHTYTVPYMTGWPATHPPTHTSYPTQTGTHADRQAGKGRQTNNTKQ